MKPLSARRILQPSQVGPRAWPCANAGWTINPYRGCQIGCVYCHARYTHEFLEFGDWRDFERRVFFKTDAKEILAHELSRLTTKWSGDSSIAIGTITDPYQPVEERLGVTRGILRALLDGLPEGIEVRINTKSDLILRDLDLLCALSRRSALRVSITITTLDHDLARALEPKAPSPRRRLNALKTLTRNGLSAGVLLMPLIPGVNDSEEAIDRLVREVRSSGALYLAEAPLLLRPSATEPFFRFLRRHYPRLERAYREAFENLSRAPERYRGRIRRRVARARRIHGLRAWPAPRKPPRTARRAKRHTLTQLEIFGS